MRDFAVDALRSAGFEVVVVDCPDEAFDALGVGGFDAALVEPALIGALRDVPAGAALALVALGANGGPDGEIAALEGGADDYLPLGLKPDELVARVRAQARARRPPSHPVAGFVRERAEVLGGMEGLPVTGPPAVVAGRVCEVALQLPGVRGVAIVELEGPQNASAVAVAGHAPFAFAAGDALDAALSRRLWSRAHTGPWSAPKPNGDVLVVAPIVTPKVAAVLGLWFDGGWSAEPGRPSLMLATAIDTAVAAAPVLAGALGERVAAARRRLEIDAVVRAGAFHPVFQPIVDLTGERTVGYEALTRFDDGAAPDQRFAAATRLGLGVTLERAAIERAIGGAANLPQEAWVSVNVSASVVLAAAELRDVIHDAPHVIVVELSEHEPVDDYDALDAALRRLDGVSICLDEASSRPASLRHVERLAPEFVKLDRSMIAGIDTDATGQARVAGLAHFASHTGIRLIAQGIERAEELDTVRALGVGFGQGFLLGRPA